MDLILRLRDRISEKIPLIHSNNTDESWSDQDDQCFEMVVILEFILNDGLPTGLTFWNILQYFRQVLFEQTHSGSELTVEEVHIKESVEFIQDLLNGITPTLKLRAWLCYVLQQKTFDSCLHFYFHCDNHFRKEIFFSKRNSLLMSSATTNQIQNICRCLRILPFQFNFSGWKSPHYPKIEKPISIIYEAYLKENTKSDDRFSLSAMFSSNTIENNLELKDTGIGACLSILNKSPLVTDMITTLTYSSFQFHHFFQLLVSKFNLEDDSTVGSNGSDEAVSSEKVILKDDSTQGSEVYAKQNLEITTRESLWKDENVNHQHVRKMKLLCSFLQLNTKTPQLFIYKNLLQNKKWTESMQKKVHLLYNILFESSKTSNSMEKENISLQNGQDGEDSDEEEGIPLDTNPHAAAILLLILLKDLPQPLLGYRHHSSMLLVVAIEDVIDRVRNIALLMQQAPKSTRSLLLSVNSLFATIVNDTSNQLTPSFLANIFSPLLIRSVSYHKMELGMDFMSFSPFIDDVKEISVKNLGILLDSGDYIKSSGETSHLVEFMISNQEEISKVFYESL